MIYKNCHELPLAVFIQVVTTNNYKLLVKEGKHSDNEIIEAWNNIYSEYFELCGSTDAKHMINTVKTIAIAENKIKIINAAVLVLRRDHNETMYRALSKMGFKAKRFDNQEEREEELKKVISRAKSLVHVLNEAERQLKQMEGEGNKKASINDFTNTIVQLGKYQGYRIDPEITTVAEYLAIQKNFKLELEWRQKKA